MKENQIVLSPDVKGGVSITPPQGCEVDKVEVVDGVLTVTFKEKLPKFKAGDVLKCKSTGQLWLRLKEGDNVNSSKTVVCIGGGFILASEEERDKFFKELEDNGYVWDCECLELRKKEKKLPNTWEGFCEINDVSDKEFYIDDYGVICNALDYKSDTSRDQEDDKNLLPNRATADAVLALCQLIQLRNAYNGDWVPDCKKVPKPYTIDFADGEIKITRYDHLQTTPLYFKTKELRDEFLRNFRPLIEKLKPLYGIKEGGEK